MMKIKIIIILLLLVTVIKSECPYWKYFTDFSILFNLPSPNMVAAQSYAESRWNPNIMSPANCIGLMQLSKPTFLWMSNYKLPIDMIYNPETNVYIGCKFMKYLYDSKYVKSVKPGHDRYMVSLAMYNAGPKWLLYAIKVTKEKTNKKDSLTYDEIRMYQPMIVQLYGYGEKSLKENMNYVPRILKYYNQINSGKLK